MSNLKFGQQLLIFRLQTINPKTGKPLTQQKLGELLGHELGTKQGYTGAAISDWERNQSRIHAGDRLLLTSLVNILKRYGGIKTSYDANLLLESGGYSALNPGEMEKIFPGETFDPPLKTNPEETKPANPLIPSGLFIPSPAEYQKIVTDAKNGPQPAWPWVIAAVIRRTTDRISAIHFLQGIVWVWIWFLTYWLISPSLKLPLIGGRDAGQALLMYAIGTLLLPPWIGAMTGANKNAFWREQNILKPFMLHLYVHQGAYVGFHVGYFLVFLLTYAQTLFGVPAVAFIEWIKTAVPLVVGYIGAHLVPYNLWLAYGRLDIKDGGIFFVFVLLGPLWALFLLEFYEILFSPVMGAIVILISLTLIAAWQASKKRML